MLYRNRGLSERLEVDSGLTGRAFQLSVKETDSHDPYGSASTARTLRRKKRPSYAKPAVSIPRFDDDSDNYDRRRESSRTNGPARGIARSLFRQGIPPRSRARG